MSDNIDMKIEGLKLLEKFYAVLSKDIYLDGENAWKFCELLKSIIYDDMPTKPRGDLMRSLPQKGPHFDSEHLLEAISDHTEAIATLMFSDSVVYRRIKKLLD